MSQSEAGHGGDIPGSENREVLRAKYLDYCSAKVAETLLGLSADQIYLLAQEAADTSRSRESGEFSYGDAVRLATKRIAAQLSLPPFELWVAAYQEDPARFEGDLLGLWESEVEAGRREEGG